MYGSRGRIGVIDLSTCTSLIAEYGIALPADVVALYSRIRLPRGEVSVEALDEMLASSRLEEAADELADAEVSVIAFGCTSGSLLHGPGFDETIRRRIEDHTKIRATTTATAVVNGLHAVGARRLSVGTPYEDEITEREREFLEGSGFEVVAIEGLCERYDRDIGRLSLDRVRALARSVTTDDADAVFLSCTNLPALVLVDELERELDLPVVTSNSATIWETLRLSESPAALPGFGRLLDGRAGAGQLTA